MSIISTRYYLVVNLLIISYKINIWTDNLEVNILLLLLMLRGKNKKIRVKDQNSKENINNLTYKPLAAMKSNLQYKYLSYLLPKNKSSPHKKLSNSISYERQNLIPFYPIHGQLVPLLAAEQHLLKINTTNQYQPLKPSFRNKNGSLAEKMDIKIVKSKQQGLPSGLPSIEINRNISLSKIRETRKEMPELRKKLTKQSVLSKNEKQRKKKKISQILPRELYSEISFEIRSASKSPKSPHNQLLKPFTLKESKSQSKNISVLHHQREPSILKDFTRERVAQGASKSINRKDQRGLSLLKIDMEAMVRKFSKYSKGEPWMTKKRKEGILLNQMIKGTRKFKTVDVTERLESNLRIQKSSAQGEEKTIFEKGKMETKQIEQLCRKDFSIIEKMEIEKFPNSSFLHSDT